MDLAPGALVTDKVRLLEPLGEGGMGAVWKAEHVTLGSHVAVKFVHSELLKKHPSLLKRFEREARAAAQIRNPHVVQILDHGKTDSGAPFMVMELLQGRSLAQRLERHGALELSDVVLLVEQIGSALAAAEKLKIVHRDIKPDNIFLLGEGKALFAKLLDFGIAKQQGGPQASSMTATGAMIGTPHYMSPEQLVNAKDVGPSADRWALAVVAYEALTGSVPFNGETLPAVVLAITGGEWVLPSRISPAGIPRAVDAWFQRALCVDAEARYANAEALADGLRIAFERAEDEDVERQRKPELSTRRPPAAAQAEDGPTPAAAADDAAAPAAEAAPVDLPELELDLPTASARAAQKSAAVLNQQRANKRKNRPQSGARRRERPASASRKKADATRAAEPRPRPAVRRPLASNAGSTPRPRDNTAADAWTSRGMRDVLVVVAIVAASAAAVLFMAPAARAWLLRVTGRSGLLLYPVAACAALILGAKVWDRGTASTLALWVAGAGLLGLGLCLGVVTLAIFVPSVQLLDGATLHLAAGIAAAVTCAGFGIAGLQRALEELSRRPPQAALGLLMLLLAAAGLASAYQMLRGPLQRWSTPPAQEKR